MIKVRQRQDLLDAQHDIPVKLFDGKGIQYRRIDKWMLASQPDELDNSEFNLCLYGTDTDGSYKLIGVAIAIDFEFGEDVELEDGGLELDTENLIVKLAKKLDDKYKVKDEFYRVILDAVNRHAELIEEQS